MAKWTTCEILELVVSILLLENSFELVVQINKVI